MALRVAVATGNWSNPTTWNGGAIPSSGDVAASNGFTVTIDQNINVDSLINAVSSNVSFINLMTGYTSAQGTASASSEYGNNYFAWKAFDGSTAGGFNSWLTTNGAFSSYAPQWLQYEFNTPTVIRSYKIIVSSFGTSSSPTNWEFQAWDGTNWVILEAVTGGSVTYSGSFTNEVAYSRYRLFITNIVNPASWCSIGELQMFENSFDNVTSVAGGGFILNDGVTVNANLTGGAVDLLTYSGSTSANINGNLLIGTGNYVVNFNSSLGTLNIVGNLQNNGTAGRGILVNNTGTVNLVGDVFTGPTSGLYHQQIFVQANGTINITGNIYTVALGCFASQIMIHLNSICTFNVVGNIEYLSNNATSARAIGINTLDCTVNITGSVYGGRQLDQRAISSGQRHFLSIIGTIYSDNFSVVSSTSGSAVNLFSGPFICSPYGFMPYQVVRMHLIPSASNYIEFRDETTGGALAPVPAAPPTQLISPSTLVSNLAITDVRFGTVYALGTLTGTLRMPTANQVTFGVAVDDTFGNSVLTAASVWDYLVSNITVEGSIGMRLKNVATPQSVGEQLEAFLRLD